MFNNFTRVPSRVPSRTLACVLALTQALPLSLLAQHAQAQQVSTTQYEYDAQGNRTKVTDPRSLVTNIAPDALDRTQTITGPAPSSTSARPTVTYGYDGQSRVSSVQDPRGNTTRYSRDGLGLNVTQTSPDTGSLTLTFDPTGPLSYRMLNPGRGASYDFDELNRPTGVSYTDGSFTILSYDAFNSNAGTENYGIGHLTRVTEFDANSVMQSSLTFTYDIQGRLKSRCTGFGVSSCNSRLTYRWDSGNTGQLLGLTYPSGRKVDYTYDAQGNISGITTTDPNGSTRTVVSSVTYTPWGPTTLGINTLYFGDGSGAQTYERDYDTDGRVNQFTLGYGANGVTTAKALYVVNYDEASRVTSIVSGSGTVKYG